MKSLNKILKDKEQALESLGCKEVIETTNEKTKKIRIVCNNS